MTIDLTHLERLGSISLAAWHARRKQRLASATASGAVVPEAVLVPAQQLRARMLKLVEYYFDEDDSLGPLVAAIRSGAGYQDLASDLHALADVYSRPVVEAVISQDPKFYQADDVATARRYAGEILSSLGMDATADAKHWTEWRSVPGRCSTKRIGRSRRQVCFCFARIPTRQSSIRPW